MTSLSINTNVSALVGQLNLSKNTTSLGRSLERLSTGFKINRSSDGPSELVISEFQRAQISGLQQSVENIDRAISLSQTAEGGLSEINALLIKIRELAVDSANNGALDANALSANQANVDNLLNSIDRIANKTRFGTFNLLDGSSGITGSSNDADVTFLTATDATIAAASNSAPLEVDITRPGERAFVEAGTQLNDGVGGTLAQDETLTINGVQVTLESGLNQQQVVDEINKVSSQTGAQAGIHVVNEIQEITIADTVPGVATTGSLTITGIDNANGGVFNITVDINNAATTAETIQTSIDTGLTATNQNNVQVLSVSKEGNSVRSIVLQYAATSSGTSGGPIAEPTMLSNLTGGAAAVETLQQSGDRIRIFTEEFGENATVTVVSNVNAADGTTTGFGTTVLSDVGVDVTGTISGEAATGVGNVLKGDADTRGSGVAVSLGLTKGEGNQLLVNGSTTPDKSTTRAEIGERQTATVSTAFTGGTFTLSFEGETTESLTFDATASEIRTALEDLSTIGLENISVQGTTASAGAGLDTVNSIDFTFQNDLSGTSVGGITIDTANLTGGTVTGPIETRAAVAAIDSNLTTVGETGGKLFGTTPASPAALTDDSIQGNVSLINNSRQFQVGAFADDSATLTLSRADTQALGIGVAGQKYSNLSQIDVQTNQGATDAITLVDAAIRDISNLRAGVGAFQSNILEATQSNLRSQLVNLQSAESLLRDTDFATEITNFTNAQIKQQAATTVLGLANQSPLSILGLLQA